ncbi:MAG: hypothetical protein JXR94_16930 [Candidatus Hydrogenedentes bacterium]|nr:hypothetical protein [Candidatus Hydrogenedentota bacterium]
MTRQTAVLAVSAVIFAAGLAGAEAPAQPDEWVDEATGHRVVRLSQRDGSNSSFYFHQNPFTAEGDLMVFAGTTPEGRRLFTVNLATRAIRQVTDRPSSHEVVAPKGREVFYLSDGSVCGTLLDSGATRVIASLPEPYHSGSGFTVNADETLLAGCYAEGVAEFYKRPRSEWFTAIFEANLPNALYTIDLASGAVREIFRENAWMGHVQFSPTDPALIMFCHEGSWHRLHRIWLFRLGDDAPRKVHPRSVENEIAGHEFWAPDGRTIWFDLQIPRGRTFYLAGADIATGEEVRYPLTRDQWSVHYNIAPDGGLFCGDGGDERSVAGASDGRWIYLFRPKDGAFEVERLCSLAGHDYHLEPNVHFTPDAKWVVFRSNMHGDGQVYAVEVARASGP